MKKLFFTTLSFLLPSLALAATDDPRTGQFLPRPTSQPSGGISGVIAKIGGILNQLVPIAVTLALLVFIWGLVIFIKNSGDEEAKKEGKRKMGWGIVTLFVIISIWGIIKFIAGEFDIGLGGTIDIPQYPTAGQSQ